jgi:hypothetical protein
MMSLRTLQSIWTLWLASFLILYAYPVAFVMWNGTPLSLIYPSTGPQSWTWSCELWLPMALALALPTIYFGILARRAGSAFVLTPVRDADALHYRASPTWRPVASPRPFRRRVSGYIVRLTMAIGFSFIPFYVLASSRFVENVGCVIYTYVRSPLEHLGFVTLLFTVALFHVPLRRRVLGADAP